MVNSVSLAIAALALFISSLTAWLTLLRSGTVRMTQPTTIFLGHDNRSADGLAHPKVYLRTLLYATAKRGCIVENMYLRVHRGETTQVFNVWVFGEERLARGSGLFVSEAGVVVNHHFLLPADGTRFTFLPGSYAVDVLATIVGRKISIRLGSIQIAISPEQSVELATTESGIFFDWSPDAASYHAHIEPSKRRLPNISPFDSL